MIETMQTAAQRRRWTPHSLRVATSAVLFVLAALMTVTARAQGALKEGVNYTVVKPTQPTDAPAGKVEVIEFFGYWCPHCNEFEPTMTDWAKRNDAKVVMSFVPIAFNASMTNLQKLYYTLDAMGKEKELRRKVFSSIHGDQSLPYNADVGAMATWAEKNGIDKKKFVDTLNSFSVSSKVNRANQMASAYGVTAVPSLGIAGKYVATVDARSIGYADALLARALTEK